MSNLVLFAPMQGWVAPLDEVPDPVFAERILGDGVAIDPTDCTVRAPCDGQIISSAKHAVTLRAANGAEILIHVGLETVALGGQGFVANVREGRSVKTGDLLLSFDLDFLAARAKSLISPVVLTNGEAFSIVRRSTDRETRVGEFLMEIRPLAGASSVFQAPGESEISRETIVMLAHGIHARPAAQLANCAKRFGAEVALIAHGKRVNAKSTAALMSLGVRGGESVTVAASGADAQAAVSALADLIGSGMGEAPAMPSAAVPAAKRELATTPFDGTIRGVCAAPGLAIGRIIRLRAAEIVVREEGAGIAHETAALSDAIHKVRMRLETAASSGNRQRSEILGAHIALLDDPEIQQAAQARILQGKSAAFSWRQSMRGFAQALREIDDPLMRERANDLLDLERQVIAAIGGVETAAAPPLPADAIIVADELLPSELVNLGEIAGICTAGGGPTSHVAILAAGMNVPALVGAGASVLSLADGTRAILDADGGVLRIEPDESALAEARARLDGRRRRAGEALVHALEDCRTADGLRIEILANLGAGAAEAAEAVRAGAEGCGLLRTEFLFLDRSTPPGEDEQAAAYQAIADALGGRPFVIRTFDIGGDKPVPYLPFPPEENPALGLRGVRAGLWRPDLLRAQLAAILRTNGRCRIMLPMIASLSEIRSVRAVLDSLMRERGLSTKIALGVMVETPACAVLADRIAEEVDFFSIGTNDLTQYTLAMDRGHPQLAAQIDAYHPAVLRLIAQAVQGARAKPVSVCGGLAADPSAAALLIGLGVNALSVPAPAIAELKARIRSLHSDACRALAEEALRQDSAAGVRAILAKPQS